MTSHSASSAEFVDVYCDDHTKHTKFMNKMQVLYEGWNFNSGNYLFTTDTK